MQEGLLTMSIKEVERVTVLEAMIGKRIQQREAAHQLKLSVRQVRRLMKRYCLGGIAGLVSKHRGRVGNRQYSEAYKAQIKEWVAKEYADFGPTLAAEKLYERQGLVVNKETLRQWMVEWGFWEAKRHKQVVLHQQRERRGQYGELVQIDGSPHDWFEGRREKCCLLVFIDDATSELLHLRFEESETTLGYFRGLRAYIQEHGLPLAWYSDKYGVFRVNLPDVKTGGETQFGRACRELGIKLICASSAQAKGRVERVNATLQDRLVKELRLRGISDMETANAFLPSYRVEHNQRFGVKPRSEINGHCEALLSEEALGIVLSIQSDRTLSKNLEFSFKGVTYQIKTKTTGYRLRHAKVRVCEGLEGEMAVQYQGKSLAYSRHEKQARVTPIVGSKQLNQMMDGLLKTGGRAQGNKPKEGHPWKQSYKVMGMLKDARLGHGTGTAKGACV